MLLQKTTRNIPPPLSQKIYLRTLESYQGSEDVRDKVPRLKKSTEVSLTLRPAFPFEFSFQSDTERLKNKASSNNQEVVKLPRTSTSFMALGGQKWEFRAHG